MFVLRFWHGRSWLKFRLFCLQFLQQFLELLYFHQEFLRVSPTWCWCRRNWRWRPLLLWRLLLLHLLGCIVNLCRKLLNLLIFILILFSQRLHFVHEVVSFLLHLTSCLLELSALRLSLLSNLLCFLPRLLQRSHGVIKLFLEPLNFLLEEFLAFIWFIRLANALFNCFLNLLMFVHEIH